MSTPVCFQDVLDAIAEIAPLSLQESYDNSGLLVGEPKTPVRGILIALDLQNAVLDEAIDLGYNLVVTHHPIIFHSIKSLRGDNKTTSILLRAIRQGVGIIAAHTNLDAAAQGVNYHLALQLGLTNIITLQPHPQQEFKLITFVPTQNSNPLREALFKAGAGEIGNYRHCSFSHQGTATFLGSAESSPYIGSPLTPVETKEIRIETVVQKKSLGNVLDALHANHPYETPVYDIIPLLETNGNTGLGAIGDLPTPVSEIDLLKLVSRALHTSCLRHGTLHNRRIQRIAVCGGSGASLISTAKRKQADVYITADCKYHDFEEQDNALWLVDAGHWETELIAVDILLNIIHKKFTTFATQKSTQGYNPVQYFINNQ